MFGNFLYYITALLIYISATETGTPIPAGVTISPSETVALFLILTLFFIVMTWVQFRHFEKRITRHDFLGLDRSFNTILSRQCLGAIAIFAIVVYGLELPRFLSRIPVFDAFSTLQAAVVLGIFVGYLTIVWVFAHNSYRRLYLADISRKAYVQSNISFAVVLAPWFLFSLILT